MSSDVVTESESRLHTSSAISSRYACSFARRSGRDVARMATASRPALAAPDGADRDRRDRHAFRHLHDREQRVEAVERRALHRHADHRQHGLRRDHARQVRGAAGARDDHFEPARDRGRRVLGHPAPACGAPTRRGIRAATPNRVSISSAWRIVSQSDLLPMMTPTSGRGSGMRVFHHRIAW